MLLAYPLVLWSCHSSDSQASVDAAVVEDYCPEQAPELHRSRRYRAVVCMEVWRQLLQAAHPYVVHFSMTAGSASACIEDFVLHIASMGTSCHTLSSSWHNCCMQLVSALPTSGSCHWLLVLPLDSDLSHVRYNVVVGGLYTGVSPSLGIGRGLVDRTDRLANDMWQVKHLKGLTLVSGTGRQQSVMILYLHNAQRTR